jgi:hypothetical protein
VGEWVGGVFEEEEWVVARLSSRIVDCHHTEGQQAVAIYLGLFVRRESELAPAEGVVP